MHTLAAFLRDHREELVMEWMATIRTFPAAAGMPDPVLRNRLPELVTQLADGLAASDGRSALVFDLEDIASTHAVARFREGYDLRQVVAEYRVFRRVVFDLYRRHVIDHSDDVSARLPPIFSLNEAIDGAIATAVDHYGHERDRAREVFVGILGHDLRNPLGAITMSASQLLEWPGGLGDGGVVRLVERVATSAAKIQRMVCDLLDFAHGRLGSGLPVTRVPVDLRALIHDTVDEMAHANPKREIRCLARSVEGDLAGVFDADRICQALSNLLGNAIQHGTDPIVVQPFDHGDTVAIEVRSGGEIPHDRLCRLFEAYFSTSEQLEKGRSLGLGLFIVREIARAHGGSIEVDTSPTTGTCFRLRLPRAPR